MAPGLPSTGHLEARDTAQFPNSGLPVADRFDATTRGVLGRPPDRFRDDYVGRLVGLLAAKPVALARRA